MKKLLFLFTFLSCFITEAQITIPSPSPAGSVSSTVGLTNITIDYFRPQVRGREVFGTGENVVVPYGKLWRTGAGDGTIITFSTKVEIAGKSIDPGKYLVLTIPGEREWEFILYNDLFIDGANLTPNFKENEVALRMNVKPIKLDQEISSLSFQINDVNEKGTSAFIQFAWSNIAFQLPVKVSFDETVMKQIENESFTQPINYVKAAKYYYNYDKDLNQALKWINAYLDQGDNNTHFWYLYVKAQILAKMGNKNEAVKTAQRAIELAKKSTRGDLGYIKRSQEIINSFE